MSEATSMVRARFRSPNEWEALRPLIMKLYVEEDKSLKDVCRILEVQYNFHATPRMFKQRFHAWGMRKYSRPKEEQNLFRHYARLGRRSTVSSRNDSPLMVDGKELCLSMAKPHLQRTDVSETSPDYGTSSSTRSRPDDTSVASSSALPDAQITLADDGEKSAITEAHSLSPCHSLSSTPSVPNPHPMNLGSRESDRLGVSSLTSSNVCSSIVDKSTIDYDDEESDARRKRRKLSAPNPVSASETRALACPFYKHNPRQYSPQNEHLDSAMRYRTCAGPGWESISRLRQHLFRAHLDLKQCRICHSILQTRSDLENHARNCLESVATDLNPTSDTISDENQHRLKQKTPLGLTKESSWRRIYNILFPHDSTYPSPYYQSDDKSGTEVTLVNSQLGQLDSLIQYLSSTLPHKIYTAWQGQPNTHGNLAATSASVSKAQDSDCVRQRSPPLQKQRCIEPEISDDVRLSASTTELEKLISETVAETCTEWLSSRKEPDDDLDEESEDENEQSQLLSTSAPGHIQQLASMTAQPGTWPWEWLPEPQREQSWTTYEDRGSSDSTIWQRQLTPMPWDYPQQPNLPSCLPSFSMFDSNFNPAAATAYDFSYLPMSPGIPFVDIPTQPNMAPSTDLDASDTGIGSGGALGTLFGPDSLSATGWATWENTNVSAAETVSSTLASEANQDP